MADALEQYRESIAKLSGFTIPGAPNIAEDRSAPAIIEFSFATISQAAKALPDSVRSAMRDAIAEAMAAALENIKDVDVSELVEESAEAIPIIGQVLALLAAAVSAFIDFTNALGELDEDMTRAFARVLTIDHRTGYNWDHAQSTVSSDSYSEFVNQDAWTWAGQAVDHGYMNYKPRDGAYWSWEPCFNPPMTTEFTLWGGITYNPIGQFEVNGGVRLNCASGLHIPSASERLYSTRYGCDVTGTDPDDQRAKIYRAAYVWIDPLWWPAFCPSFPSVLLPPGIAGDEDFLNPTRLLMERQFRILSNPKDNFAFHLSMSSARAMALLERIKFGIENEALQVCELEDGEPVSGGGNCAAWILDTSDRRGKGWEPAPLNAFFFIDGQGIVQSYNHPDSPTDNLANWGFPVKREGPTLRWLSLADVNAIVGNVRAAWTARQAFLDDSLLCKVLRDTGWVNRIKAQDEELYAAVLASAALLEEAPPRKQDPYGPGLPGSPGGSRETGPRKPGEPAGPRRPGEGIGASSEDGGGAGIIVGLAALGGLAYLRSRRGRR